MTINNCDGWDFSEGELEIYQLYPDANHHMSQKEDIDAIIPSAVVNGDICVHLSILTNKVLISEMNLITQSNGSVSKRKTFSSSSTV